MFIGIIAGLPMNLPSHQTSVTESYLSGDNAWMIVATCFGILLSPALAFLYGKLIFRQFKST
jgi:hypothetical protein